MNNDFTRKVHYLHHVFEPYLDSPLRYWQYCLCVLELNFIYFHCPTSSKLCKKYSLLLRQCPAHVDCIKTLSLFRNSLKYALLLFAIVTSDCKVPYQTFDCNELYQDICGLFPCTDFLRHETMKVVWVLSFDHLRFRIYQVFRNSYVRFSLHDKVTIILKRVRNIY